MSNHQAEARFQCRHILADGRRCRAACLRHEEFCYYHHASRKPVANPAGRKSRRGTFALPRIEDRASILLAVNEILAHLTTNDIDARRAGRLLYALQIAACSMPRLAAARPVDEEDSGLIEEVVQHPAYGEIAPRSELAIPERDKPRKSLAQELREEMEALEARNIAEFGASADDAHGPEPAPIVPQTNDIEAELREAREELESRQDRIHGMHKDLAKYREDLAKAKSELIESRVETQRAEETMVWHMDRHAEARAELEALQAATQPEPGAQPAILPRLQAVAESPLKASATEAGCPIHRAFVPRDEWASSEARPISSPTPQTRHSELRSSRSCDERSRRTPRPLTPPTPPNNSATKRVPHSSRLCLSR